MEKNPSPFSFMFNDSRGIGEFVRSLSECSPAGSVLIEQQFDRSEGEDFYVPKLPLPGF